MAIRSKVLGGDAPECRGCGQPLHTAGRRGLCAPCLVATTTGGLSGEAEPSEATPEEELAYGASVGANGRFLLLDKLGEGGMGEVWLAKDQELSRKQQDHLVALKFISPSIRHDHRALEALRSEVLSSQALSHPNIVRIFDLHLSDHGMPFIKMEYVEGNSLRKWLKDEPSHVMPWRLVTQLTHQLASALRYAHEKVGIVHRDLKPANLLLDRGQVLKLSDFGISQSITARAGSSDELVALGTLVYASPQQLAGEPPTPADDIYSLGATLYELLSGTPPFVAETPEEMIRIIQEELPDPIPERLAALGRRNYVPAKLLILVQRCLDKDPHCRPKTHEISHLLPQITNASSEFPRVLASPLSTEEPEPSHQRTSRSTWIRVGVVLLLVGLGGGAAWSYRQDLSSQASSLWTQLSQRVQAGSKKRPSPTAGGLPKSGPVVTTNIPSAVPDANLQITDATAVENQETTSDTNTSSNATDVVQEKAPACPITVAADISIRTTDPRLWHRCIIRNTTGTLVSDVIQPARNLVFTNALQPGVYYLRVSEGPKWNIESTLEVQANQSTNVQVAFLYGKLCVTSEPTNALVKWSGDPFPGTEGHTPFSHDFRGGNIPFEVSAPGHRPLSTNYLFNPALTTNLHIRLQQSASPLRGEDWTNSLGMTFRWIGGLSAWVCATETRVADYRPFAKYMREELKYETTNRMYSVTVNGAVQAGFSWDYPGFKQAADHPVVGVNWRDAVMFCEWLTVHEQTTSVLASNQHYRLPATNQWFALAGRQRFPWGSNPAALAGNYSGQEATQINWPAQWPVIGWHVDEYPRTAPVTSLGTNRLGLYHLGGNVAEWCMEKVLCGRSWADGESDDAKEDLQPLEYLETSRVQFREPSERNDRNGFRIMICEETEGSAH